MIPSDTRHDGRGRELLGSVAMVRELDSQAMAEWGNSGPVMMELAGSGAARLIRARSPKAGRAVILCGPGHNGGDGYAVARHLMAAGWSAVCLSLGPISELRGEGAAQAALWTRHGGETREVTRGPTARMGHLIGHATVVVDALFGTGLSRPLAGGAAALVALANDRGGSALRVALDIPSGIHGDRGTVLGAAFKADFTATFALATPGLYQGAGRAHAGDVVPVDTGIPSGLLDTTEGLMRRVTAASVARGLPLIPRDGHKGVYGHVGVLGGFEDLEGAGCLAAQGALRAGAGLVTWVSETTGRVVRPPEVMVSPFGGTLPDRPGHWIVGPGLGTTLVARRALEAAAMDPRPQVWDADALNLVAALKTLDLIPDGSVITPHPAEAARLLGVATSDILEDPQAAALALVASLNAVVVLKGATTWVAATNRPSLLVDLGHVALATGGSGDVLAGVIAALMAQGLPAYDAAWVGVGWHGVAGREVGTAVGPRGGRASEIAEALPRARAQLLGGWA